MSGVAEGIAGLALSAVSVASLFTTCIECYSLVVAAREFGRDYELLCTELSLQKLRFLLWGESVGLAPREPQGQPRPNPGLDDLYIQPTVIRTLNAIKNLLSETQEFDERYGFKTEDASSGSISRGLSIFRGTFDQFKIQTCRNQKQKSVTTLTRWAIFDAEHFEVKITRLRGFNDGLESITTSLVALELQRDRLRHEIESISDVESLRLLRDISDPATDDVSDTASRRLTYIESSTHADATSIITRTETSTTNQTFVTARSQWITENSLQEENMESQNEQPLSNKTSLPSSTTESSGPIQVKFNSRKRSFRILGRTKPGSTVKHPNDAASAQKAYGEHDRDHPGQLARQLAGPSRAAEKIVLYKLVVMGDRGVGKTALTIQLTLQHFFVTYDPTVEDSYRKQVVIDGISCMLEVLDTAGQEEYTALRNQWIRDGEGFLLVYSICERSSFTRVSRFHHQIMNVKGVVGARPPVMLVGHHYHEDEEGNFEMRDREVSIQEGQALGKELGCDFVEASAHNCINVEKAFYGVVRALRRQRAPGMPIISG